LDIYLINIWNIGISQAMAKGHGFSPPTNAMNQPWTGENPFPFHQKNPLIAHALRTSL